MTVDQKDRENKIRNNNIESGICLLIGLNQISSTNDNHQTLALWAIYVWDSTKNLIGIIERVLNDQGTVSSNFHFYYWKLSWFCPFILWNKSKKDDPIWTREPSLFPFHCPHNLYLSPHVTYRRREIDRSRQWNKDKEEFLHLNPLSCQEGEHKEQVQVGQRWQAETQRQISLSCITVF